MGQPIWDYSCEHCTRGKHDKCTDPKCYCAYNRHFQRTKGFKPRHRRHWWQRRNK